MSWLLEAVLECRRMEIGRMEILCWGKGEREVCMGERGSFTLASFIGENFFVPFVVEVKLDYRIISFV